MDGFTMTDLVGYSAALMTLVTFAQKRMMLMRMSAIGANLLFIGYGALGPFYPVAMLHAVLLPLNIARLSEHWRRRRAKIKGAFPGQPALIEQWERACR